MTVKRPFFYLYFNWQVPYRIKHWSPTLNLLHICTVHLCAVTFMTKISSTVTENNMLKLVYTHINYHFTTAQGFSPQYRTKVASVRIWIKGSWRLWFWYMGTLFSCNIKYHISDPWGRPTFDIEFENSWSCDLGNLFLASNGDNGILQNCLFADSNINMYVPFG